MQLSCNFHPFIKKSLQDQDIDVQKLIVRCFITIYFFSKIRNSIIKGRNKKKHKYHEENYVTRGRSLNVFCCGRSIYVGNQKFKHTNGI